MNNLLTYENKKLILNIVKELCPFRLRNDGIFWSFRCNCILYNCILKTLSYQHWWANRRIFY